MLKKSLLTAGTILMAGTVAIVGPQSAEALTRGTYQLNSHKDGGLYKNGTSPQYGLRLDGLFGGNEKVTFDFDWGDSDVKLQYKNDKIRIFGTAYGGKAQDGSYVTSANGTGAGYWDIDMTYTVDEVRDDGSLWVTTSAGEGTISSVDDPNLSFNLIEKSKEGNDPYSFAIDTGHRREGGYSGWGWVMKELEDGSYVRNKTQDFLFKVGDAVVEVPEPATMSLLSLGLVGLGMGALKRKKA